MTDIKCSALGALEGWYSAENPSAGSERYVICAGLAVLHRARDKSLWKGLT
jgi:hypothetical protein